MTHEIQTIIPMNNADSPVVTGNEVNHSSLYLVLSKVYIKFSKCIFLNIFNFCVWLVLGISMVIWNSGIWDLESWWYKPSLKIQPALSGALMVNMCSPPPHHHGYVLLTGELVIKSRYCVFNFYYLYYIGHLDLYYIDHFNLYYIDHFDWYYICHFDGYWIGDFDLF